MKTLIVILLCVAASIAVIVYEIARVKKEYKGYKIIPLSTYDGYKLYYIISFVFTAIAYCTYFSDPTTIWCLYAGVAILMLLSAKFGRRLDLRIKEEEERMARMNKHTENINDYYRKNH